VDDDDDDDAEEYSPLAAVATTSGVFLAGNPAHASNQRQTRLRPIAAPPSKRCKAKSNRYASTRKVVGAKTDQYKYEGKTKNGKCILVVVPYIVQ
jgi:hypothetical protein